MTTAFISPDTENTCSATGEVCPERQRIVELYSVDDETRRILTQNMDIEDSVHPRNDSRKMQGSLALHRWKEEARGCDGAKNEICGMRDPHEISSNVSWLGRLASKLVRAS